MRSKHWHVYHIIRFERVIIFLGVKKRGDNMFPFPSMRLFEPDLEVVGAKMRHILSKEFCMQEPSKKKSLPLKPNWNARIYSRRQFSRVLSWNLSRLHWASHTHELLDFVHCPRPTKCTITCRLSDGTLRRQSRWCSVRLYTFEQRTV